MSRPSDHFSLVARDYAAARPRYPAAWFGWLASICPAHDLALDCAAGSGQASVDLSDHFARVIALDRSAAQISAAPPHPRVEYRVGAAEATGLESASVDLVTVAQALHWLDLDRFHPEARRILRPGGVLAAWTYGKPRIDDDVLDGLVQDFYHETVGPFWPDRRQHVESGYATLSFPSDEIAAPSFAMRESWPVARLVQYLRSWSATARFVAHHGFDPVAALAISDTDRIVGLTWPFTARVARIGGGA